MPASAMVVIVTLALGIRANTAIFTEVNDATFRPLPYSDRSHLVMLRETVREFPQMG